ncbi:ribosomal protein S18-alanine N-acetyltransferase [Pseudidiomarina homiensis]|uniref:[Ribosomal protein bS18]-alanine N-acetyltransferase n=1 Tax=Pseudidiomarina homiensis TaxID=364198 RepID=A0A432XT95_9GAMM|nr:ribosomal protein S18-alanine N-acetyltransferase [Pseudidiomarina homiensis]RUO51801.1 ribosomal-protein-alanine N-acetyltransferase [Pseudidiomarina homiensis]
MITRLTHYEPRMLAIEQASHVVPWSERTLESCFQADYRVYGWFAGSEKVLQGFYIAHLVCDELTLMNIAVHPDLQGQGIGRLLMQHLLTLATQEHASIWLEVRASNRPAQALYLSVGFSEVGRRPDYYAVANGREDAVVMRWDAADRVEES